MARLHLSASRQALIDKTDYCSISATLAEILMQCIQISAWKKKRTFLSLQIDFDLMPSIWQNASLAWLHTGSVWTHAQHNLSCVFVCTGWTDWMMWWKLSRRPPSMTEREISSGWRNRQVQLVALWWEPFRVSERLSGCWTFRSARLAPSFRLIPLSRCVGELS